MSLLIANKELKSVFKMKTLTNIIIRSKRIKKKNTMLITKDNRFLYSILLMNSDSDSRFKKKLVFYRSL